MASIVKALPDYEIYGFMKSFDGVIDKDYTVLTRETTSHIRRIGWTILKTVNKWRFGAKTGGGDATWIDPELVRMTKKSYDELWLDGLCVLWGDGTLTTALQLHEAGIHTIGIPKSIDNDLQATDFTFGFMSAVDIVSEAMQRLHTTASSHDRVMVVEVMGRHTGWIALYAGMAGAASVILLPEMPFSYEHIVAHLEARRARWRHAHIIVVAEWAASSDGEKVLKNDGSSASEILYGGIGEALTAYLNTTTTFEARNNQLGHIQRGWSPNAYDLILATSYGAYAARMVREGVYGNMVVFTNNTMTHVPLADAVDGLKKVTPDHYLVELGKSLGICFW